MLLVVVARLHIFGKLYPDVRVFFESFALYVAQNGAVRRPKSAFQLFLRAGSRTGRERYLPILKVCILYCRHI